MRYRVTDPAGGEIRNLTTTEHGKLLGPNVADICQGTEIITTGISFPCFADASYSSEIEVIEVTGVANGPGYIRMDILELVDE